MNKKYPIAIIVAVLVLLAVAGGAYMISNKKSHSPAIPLDAIASSSVTPLPSLSPKGNPASQENWKTYTSEKGYFSIQYPSQWIAEEYPGTQELSTAVTLSGEEGSIAVNWGSGFGGACNGDSGAKKENITIGKDEFNVCHTPKNTADSETWTLLYKDLGSIDGKHMQIGISAGANAPAADTRDTVLKVLQSLQFQVK